jgi:hypothetical protein
VSVDLEPVPQAGLHDVFGALDLADQTMHIGMKILVDFEEMPRHDRAEENATEAGCGVGGQHQMSQRNTTSGGDGPRVPDLEFGEDHRQTTLVLN